MNTRIVSIASFTAACLITTGAWCILWPEKQEGSPVVADPVPAARAARTKPVKGALADLGAAQTDRARLQAAEQIEQLPLEAFPAAFDGVTLYENASLTRSGKLLLIRWAGLDGPAAAEWAWLQLRGEGGWPYAFKEIAASWAWHDPAGLAAWTLEKMKDYIPGDDSITLEEALRTDSAVLMSGEIDKAIMALAKEKPRLAYQLLMKKGSQSSHENIAALINTPEGIRDALLAFDKVEIKYKNSESDLMFQLMKRWQELAPEDFSRSPHAALLEESPGVKPVHQVINTDGWIDLPAEERAAGATAKIESYHGKARGMAAAVIASSWTSMDHAACWNWIETLPQEHQAPAAAGYAKMNALDHLDETLDRIEHLPASLRNRALIAAYSTWASKNSGIPDNFDTWPPDRRQTWEDLNALWQVQSD